MQIKLNNKTYTMPTVKAKVLRKALTFNEKMDFNNIKAKDLDELVDFVCEVYGNQFSVDDIYENLEAKELLPTLIDSIQAITGETANKLNEFPKNELAGEMKK